MSERRAVAKSSAEEADIIRRLAKALWKAQAGDQLPNDAAQRRDLWQRDKAASTALARRVYRRLRRSGIEMSADPKVPAATVE